MNMIFNIKKNWATNKAVLLVCLLTGIGAGIGSGSALANNPTVIVSPVEESDRGAPVRVNGAVRAIHDILLPARAEGQLIWALDEGARVSSSDVLAQLDRRQLEITLAEEQLMLQRAEVNHRYLDKEVKRLQALEAKNLAATTQLAEMTSRRDLSVNDIQVAQSRIERITDNLSRTEIVSPIDGVIVERLKEQGEYARVGETVLRVVDPSTLEIIAAVPVANLNRIDFQGQVNVTLTDINFTAKLKSIIHVGDQSSQMFNVIVEVPREMAPNMVTGQFVEVDVPLLSSRYLYVPRDAVVLRSDGSYVFRINNENVAERVNVVLGKGKGNMVSIISAEGSLENGDRVAIRGVETLQDGQEVNPVAS